MCPPRGTTLLVVILLVYLGVLYGREAFPRKSLPTVSAGNTHKISVLLGDGFPVKGIHQYSDGIGLESVIKLAIRQGDGLTLSVVLSESSLIDGELLSLVVKDAEIIAINRSWMPASQRIACGIALHPDRMSLADWEDLPGVGPRLAEKIEENRQKNGEFGVLEALGRVDGVGPKSIASWRRFFVDR